MELLLLVSLSSVLALSLIVLLFKHKLSGGPKLPPGSFGWPILGETIEFLFGNPEKFVGDRMRRYSSTVFKTKILGEKVAVFCGPAGNKFIFSNEQKLVTEWRPHSMQKLMRSYEAKSPAPPPTNPNDSKTKVLRQPGFLKPEALSRFMEQMDSTTQQHMKLHWEGQSKVLVFPVSKNFTLSLASKFFLGLNEHDRITRLANEFDDVSLGLHSIPWKIPGTIFYNASNGATAIRKALLSVIREKKEALANGARSHDILTYMVAAADPATGRMMPETEIADKMMGLLTAGYSTVAGAITFLMKFVAERPDIYDRILAEQLEIKKSKNPGETLVWEDIQKMKYSWNVTSEVLRLTPPLQGTFREAMTDITYEGYTIPKGWKIYWTVSSTNKDPTYFPDPETFDPARYEEGNAALPPYTYVPFGGGPRLCPGKEYARLVILTFLHNVVNRFKWELVDPKEKIIEDMMPAPSKGLPVRLIPHSA
ncbi:beta-amyrin 28-monooxygenase-like [Syzygium oleosum]|uniref:beta-amyrin 28-monooxygenase-like n=1 Tax=Syzygium oleosum TaxID=219896 RepID=UPI0011D1A1F8|nr:beta-amyrin 28-monooxygenase-like [Syzygium oleosum]